VVELSVGPLHRVVALLAGRRESSVRHWRSCRVVVVLMATDAGGAGDVVVVVDVAIGASARRHHMCAGQWESGLRVIKLRRLPSRGVVAGFAGLREPTGNVVGIRGVLEILQMTAHARDAGQVVVVVDMAVRAGARRDRVGTGQGKVHHRVIEGCRGPGDSGVALGAVRREIGGDVIRIGGALEVFQVARNAIGAGQVVVVVDMAVDALARWNSVSAGEHKPGGVVIELGVKPVVGGVAGLAGGGELGADVVRIYGRLKVGGVARVALSGEPHELAAGRAFVAGVTIDGGVGTGEREAIVVLLNVFDRNLPSADGVARFAVGPELALVNVGVAILATLSDVGEDHLHVTLRARDRSVHAAQGISCLIVIELRDGADRLPGCRGVAVLTGNVQIPVRAMRAARDLRLHAADKRSEGQAQ